MHHLSTLTRFGLAFILANARPSHGQIFVRGGKLPTLELASAENLEDGDTYLQRKGKGKDKEKAEKIQILPLDIPLDRAFDVQWNPPGQPKLDTSVLQPPFYDWGERDGHYTFAKLNQDGEMSFVRQKSDGTVCSVFEKVDFVAISDKVLMMRGNPDPSWIGSGYGTLIKGKGIPAGDEDGVYDTGPVDSVEIAKEWLTKNFQQQGAVATDIGGPILSCQPISE